MGFSHEVLFFNAFQLGAEKGDSQVFSNEEASSRTKFVAIGALDTPEDN